MASRGEALVRGLPPRLRGLSISRPLLTVIVLAGLALALLLPLNGPYPWWLLVLVGAGFLAWHAATPGAGARDPYLLPIVAALCAMGLLAITRVDARLGSHQAANLLVGLLILVAGQRFFVRYRDLENVTYFWLALSAALFILLRLFGQEVNGARLWFRIGPLAAQPAEVIKLFMVFFMAAYLAKNGRLLTALPLSAGAANLRLLAPLLMGWGLSILTLMLQRDVGMAGLFLGVSLVTLYVASRRLDLVGIAAAVFIAGTLLLAQHFPYVQSRIAVWRAPWSDPLGAGYQAEQAYFSLAAGGLFGTGYHLGHPGFIPDAATDYIFAAWAEEFGVVGGVALLALYLALVVRSMRIAFAAADTFTALLATGFAATLAIQVFVIIGGVVGLLPLTGITLPFFSYGGSSAVANLLMINMLWLFSAPRAPDVAVPAPDAGAGTSEAAQRMAGT